jgi:putative transposase
VSFGCQVQRATTGPRRSGARVGVDVGLHHLAVLSDGRQVPNPAPLHAALRELRRHNRQLSRRQGPITSNGTRREPSKGWLAAKCQLGRTHARVANLRRNALHHLTSDLAATYGTVVVEHLNVAGMLRNRSLARRLADAGFGELRRQLTYKCAWAGSRLVQADTFYPSSKTCSGCGHVKAKLSLSERTYCCGSCGLVADRDLNAARNLAALVDVLTDVSAPVVAGNGPETLKTPVDGGVSPSFGRAVPGEAGSRRRAVRSG